MHVGIDTVRLRGEGFRPLVRSGDRVVVGEALAQVDLDAIVGAGLDPVVMTIVTHAGDRTFTPVDGGARVTAGAPVLRASGIATSSD